MTESSDIFAIGVPPSRPRRHVSDPVTTQRDLEVFIILEPRFLWAHYFPPQLSVPSHSNQPEEPAGLLTPRDSRRTADCLGFPVAAEELCDKVANFLRAQQQGAPMCHHPDFLRSQVAAAVFPGALSLSITPLPAARLPTHSLLSGTCYSCTPLCSINTYVAG